MATKRIVVVGGGITGLATAWGLLRRDPTTDVVVLEASARAGGNVRTDEVDGFTVDHGPNGFLAKGEATLRLVEALGLTPSLAPASSAAKFRYIFRDDRLEPVPTNPLQMLRSPLLGARGVRELLGEPFRPPRAAPDEEETVSAFLRRRFGGRMADELAAPMVAGITGGDARHVSVDALFPRLVQLEAEGGSVIRGAVRSAISARRTRGARRGPRPAKGSLTFSFDHGGMGRLPEALASGLGDRLRCGTRVASIERADEGSDGAPWRVNVDGGEAIEAAQVVVATPAFVAADLLRDVLPSAHNDLAAIHYAGVRVLALGYRVEDVPRPVAGFGYLVARGARHRSLGCLWTSSIFPHQAPPGHVALRVIAGGANDPSFVDLDDEHALLAVQRDLRASMGITRPPVLVRHVVWPRAIPQYGVGHVARVERLERLVREQAPGLHLASNAYRGVSVNDCTERAERLVRELAGPPTGR